MAHWAVVLTLPCPIFGIAVPHLWDSLQSAHLLCDLVLGYWCQMPVTPTRKAPVSLMSLRGKGEESKICCWFELLQRCERKQGDGKRLWGVGWWTSNNWYVSNGVCVTQHATLRGMLSVGRGLYHVLICATFKLAPCRSLHRSHAALPHTPSCLWFSFV